jgi:hypothetical protein
MLTTRRRHSVGNGVEPTSPITRIPVSHTRNRGTFKYLHKCFFYLKLFFVRNEKQAPESYFSGQGSMIPPSTAFFVLCRITSASLPWNPMLLQCSLWKGTSDGGRLLQFGWIHPGTCYRQSVDVRFDPARYMKSYMHDASAMKRSSYFATFVSPLLSSRHTHTHIQLLFWNVATKGTSWHTQHTWIMFLQPTGIRYYYGYCQRTHSHSFPHARNYNFTCSIRYVAHNELNFITVNFILLCF